MNSLRIIFMGTPEFAVPSLEELIRNSFDVAAVVTAPDKPQGRGQKMVPSAVKVAAQSHGIPILQPTNLKDAAFHEALKSLGANLQVVVAFRMLPEVVWAMPSLGTFNLHASLLPQYRGAAPINWAIIKGEQETGVTTFFLQQEIDTGKIIFQEREPILDTDDAGTLYERLMIRGGSLVVKTARAIASGEYTSVPQTTVTEIKSAPKIFRETCAIEWNQPCRQIRNFVRGLSPYPAAWTVLNGNTYKVFKTSLPSIENTDAVGAIQTDKKNYLYVKALDGWISIDELQPEGKKRMGIAEFFRGNKL